MPGRAIWKNKLFDQRQFAQNLAAARRERVEEQIPQALEDQSSRRITGEKTGELATYKRQVQKEALKQQNSYIAAK